MEEAEAREVVGGRTAAPAVKLADSSGRDSARRRRNVFTSVRTAVRLDELAASQPDR